MQIQLEPHETNTIQAYHDTAIKINEISYEKSFIVSLDKLITPWDMSPSYALDEKALRPLLELEPEVIILGSSSPGKLMQSDALFHCMQQRIGIECLDIGAACRTFNILLGEQRRVAAGFILPG